MMRRQGQYGDSGVNTYTAAAPMHNMSGQMMEHKSSHFEGRLEAFTPERDNPYATSKSESQWRWERDGSKGSNPMASHMYNEVGTDSQTSQSLTVYALDSCDNGA